MIFKRQQKYTSVSCESCHHRYPLERNVVMRTLSQTTWEYLQRCPSCGRESSLYKSTKALERQRKELEDTLKQARTVKTQAAWDLYKKRQSLYQEEFDKVNPRNDGRSTPSS